MEFHGKIIEVLEPRSGVSPKNGDVWQSLDFVVEKDGRYPVRICFNIFGSDRIKAIAPKVGEFLTVHFDISARCSNGKWFNDVSCYKVDRSSKTQTNVNTQEEQAVLNVLQSDDDNPF